MSNSLKVFLSHKTVTHGNAAQELSEILYNALDEECKNKLEIYCSPDLKPGEIWRQTIYNQLKNADLFIVLYLAEGENVKMAWCDFEAGFYEGFSSSIGGRKRRLVPVVAEGKTPPCPLSEHEVIYLNYQGIKKLLQIIFDFDDNKKKVNPNIFKQENEKELHLLINRVLESLSSFTRETITPRLWITLSNILANKIKKGDRIKQEELSDVHLRGESEALKEFGIGPRDGVTFGNFYQDSAYKRSLDFFVPHLLHAIKNILNENFDNVFLPPIRVTDSGYARTLVPAYIEKTTDKQIKIEFFVYKPLASFNVETTSPFNTLFNLFVVAWRFRWLVLENNLSELLNQKQFFGKKEMERDIEKKLENIKQSITLILLDAMNRGLEYSRKIKRVIDDKSDKDEFSTIVDTQTGLWAQYSGELFSGIEKYDPNKVIEALEKMIPVNKAIILISLKALLKNAEELEEDSNKI